jgi:outer membrane lipoprotein SlyB
MDMGRSVPVDEHRTIAHETLTDMDGQPGQTEAKIRAPGIPHGDEELGGAITGGVAGAVIGSVIGGPVGAVIGGAVGAASGAVAGAVDQKSKDDTVRR